VYNARHIIAIMIAYNIKRVGFRLITNSTLYSVYFLCKPFTQLAIQAPKKESFMLRFEDKTSQNNINNAIDKAKLYNVAEKDYFKANITRYFGQNIIKDTEETGTLRVVFDKMNERAD
jgi:hypothetical protein